MRAQTRGAWKLIEACSKPGFGGKTYSHEHEPEALRGSSRLAQEQASEAKRIGTSKNPRRVEASRLAQGQASEQNVLARARIRGSPRLIEVYPSRDLGGKSYWHEHKPELLGSSSRLGGGQASEAKRIGTSTNLRRFEAHRGLPKNRPRKQNVLARARAPGASRLIEACPRPGLGSKTHWHELTPRPPGPETI